MFLKGGKGGKKISKNGFDGWDGGGGGGREKKVLAHPRAEREMEAALSTVQVSPAITTTCLGGKEKRVQYWEIE